MDISVYIIDCTRGSPAAGVPVSLERLTDGNWEKLARHRTDDNGLVVSPGFSSDRRGMHRISIDIDSYFVGLGLEPFYPNICITFRVSELAESAHIPVLIAPYGFSSYSAIRRGPGMLAELDRV